MVKIIAKSQSAKQIYTFITIGIIVETPFCGRKQRSEQMVKKTLIQTKRL